MFFPEGDIMTESYEPQSETVADENVEPETEVNEVPDNDYFPIVPAVPEGDVNSESAKAAAKQAADDAKWFAENPNKPLIRGTNPLVGGEG